MMKAYRRETEMKEVRLRKAGWLGAAMLIAMLISAACGREPAPTPTITPPTTTLNTMIVDTDQYQGFTPSELRARAGDLVELTITNEDHRARKADPAANSHPIVLVGPNVSKGILELRPGQTKTITFTATEGTYRFFCAEGACDIHNRLRGTIVVTE